MTEKIIDIWKKIAALDFVKTDIPAPDNDRDPILEEQEAGRQFDSGVTPIFKMSGEFDPEEEIKKAETLWSKITRFFKKG